LNFRPNLWLISFFKGVLAVALAEVREGLQAEPPTRLGFKEGHQWEEEMEIHATQCFLLDHYSCSNGRYLGCDESLGK
jgi:hypothetical protein